MKKSLSIVYTARNDDYSPDFLKRLETSLNLNIKNILDLRLQNLIEIILIDWGSKKNKKIADNIKIIKKINFLKIYHVSETSAKKFSKNWPYEFNESAAYNLGVLKSNSKFVIYTQHDSFFSKSGVQNLISLTLNKYKINDYENKLYFVPTKFINYNFYKKNLKLDLINIYLEKLNHSTLNLKSAHFNTISGQGAILLSKNNWIISTGFREKYEKYSIDLDFHFRLANLFSKLNTLYFGIHVFTLPREIKTNRTNKISKFPRLYPISSKGILYKKNSILNKKSIPLVKLEKIKIIKNKKNNKFKDSGIISTNIKLLAKTCAENYLINKNKKTTIDQIINLVQWINISKTINLIEVGSFNCEKILKIISSENNNFLNFYAIIKNLEDREFFNSYFELMHKKLNKIHHGYIRNCFSDNLLGIKKFIKDIHIEDSNTIINLNLHSNVDIKYANQFLNIFKEKLKMISLISIENNSGLSENFFTNKNSDFCRVIKNKNYSLYLNKKKKEFFYSHYPIKRLTIVNLYIYYNYFRLRNFVKKLILNRY